MSHGELNPSGRRARHVGDRAAAGADWSPELEAWRDAPRSRRRRWRLARCAGTRRLRRLPRRPGPRGRGPGRAGSHPDVAHQRLVAAVLGRRLGARLAPLLGALGEHEPARADVARHARANASARSLWRARSVGTGCRRSWNGGRRVSTRPSRPARRAAGRRAGARRGSAACRRRRRARRARPRSARSPPASPGQLAAQVAGRARLDRQRAGGGVGHLAELAVGLERRARRLRAAARAEGALGAREPDRRPGRARPARARARRAAPGRRRRRPARRTPPAAGPPPSGRRCDRAAARAGAGGRRRGAPRRAAAHQHGGELHAAVGLADPPALARRVAVGGAREQLAVQRARSARPAAARTGPAPGARATGPASISPSSAGANRWRCLRTKRS